MTSKACPTPGFQKLLVATDGSRFSKAAVDEAIRIARTCGSALTVLSVLEIGPEFEFWDAKFMETWEKEFRRGLDAVARRVKRAGVKFDVVVYQSGDAFEAIVAEARKRKVNTIILGSHGRTGLKRLMMGSVAARVVGHAPCNVLIVPAKKKG